MWCFSIFFSDQHILSRTRRPFSDGGEPLAASISEQPPQLRLSNAIYRFFLDRPVSSSGVPFDSCERSSRAFAVCSLPARLSFCATRRSKDCRRAGNTCLLADEGSARAPFRSSSSPKTTRSDSHLPHAASDRLRDSSVPSCDAFATSCTPCIILCPSSLV